MSHNGLTVCKVYKGEEEEEQEEGGGRGDGGWRRKKAEEMGIGGGEGEML